MFMVPALMRLFLLAVLLQKGGESELWRCFFLFDKLFLTVMFILALGYLFARVFVITESFISLRRASLGVFVSPEWVELFPHF
jgi:hypothetical protein